MKGEDLAEFFDLIEESIEMHISQAKKCPLARAFIQGSCLREDSAVYLDRTPGRVPTRILLWALPPIAALINALVVI